MSTPPVGTPTPDDQIIADLKNLILVRSPFTTTELTDPIMNQALSDAMDLLNKYKPNVVKLTEISYDPTFKLLVAYSDIYDSASIIPYVEEYEAPIAMLWVYAIPWTLQYISSVGNEVAYRHLKDLMVAYTSLYMANKRRTASMGSSPFDLKGDQFYNEAKDEIDKITELLVNTMVTSY